MHPRHAARCTRLSTSLCLGRHSRSSFSASCQALELVWIFLLNLEQRSSQMQRSPSRSNGAPAEAGESAAASSRPRIGSARHRTITVLEVEDEARRPHERTREGSRGRSPAAPNRIKPTRPSEGTFRTILAVDFRSNGEAPFDGTISKPQHGDGGETERPRLREGEIMVAPNVKAETMRLMDRRAALEAEMDAIIAALSAPGGPGISGGLVDAEGFPRSDIDIPAVLAQRRKLGELRNDHKDITNKIEKNLEVLHSTKLSRNEQSFPRSSGISAPLHSELSQNDPMEEDLVTGLPFAMIDEITDGSPAVVDGLLLGDEIVKFGNVEAGDRLQERLVSEALSNEDNQVSLVIIRQGSPMNLTVTPRKWHGRGLLGCHFRIF